MDRLQAMQTLVRVVELGSFSAAAREAGSTQSAISKQVAALEKQLGAQLLARSTRALKLTEAGARYVDEARVGDEANPEWIVRHQVVVQLLRAHVRVFLQQPDDVVARFGH